MYGNSEASGRCLDCSTITIHSATPTAFEKMGHGPFRGLAESRSKQPIIEPHEYKAQYDLFSILTDPSCSSSQQLLSPQSSCLPSPPDHVSVSQPSPSLATGLVSHAHHKPSP